MTKANSAGKRLLIAVILFGAVVPLFSTAVLGPARTALASDIMVPAIIPSLMGFIANALDLAALYAAYACVGYAAASGRKMTAVLLIAGLPLPVIYMVSVLADKAFYGSVIVGAGVIVYSVISCIVEFLRLAAAAGICMLVVRQARKRVCPESLEILSVRGIYSRTAAAASLVMTISLLISNLIETVTLLIEIGAPVNMSETLSLISPYITTVIWAILGYFIVYLVLRMLVRDESIKEKRNSDADNNQTSAKQ